MTEEQVREEIAKKVAVIYRRHFPHCPNSEVPINFGYEVADQILSIKGLRIEAENQELPENPYAYRSKHSPTPNENLENGCSIGFSRATDDMLIPDSDGNVWVKCEKEEHG